MANIEPRWMLVRVVLAFIVVGIIILMLASVEIRGASMKSESRSMVLPTHIGDFAESL